MAYNKEYYERHKEEMKKSRDKYRHNAANREKINQQQREKYQSLSYEEKIKRVEQLRKKRLENPEKSRIQYRIDLKRRQLKQYNDKYDELDHRLFMLNMVDTWDGSDYKYSNELSAQMRELKEKIDNKKREILELKQEKEKINGRITD